MSKHLIVYYREEDGKKIVTRCQYLDREHDEILAKASEYNSKEYGTKVEIFEDDFLSLIGQYCETVYSREQATSESALKIALENIQDSIAEIQQELNNVLDA